MFSRAHTIEDWIRQGAEYFQEQGLFFGHGTDNAFDEAAALLVWVLKIEWHDLDARMQEALSAEQSAILAGLYKRRVEERVPAAYLTGEAWFAGFKFSVNADVLVPRSPIAELIQNEYRPWLCQSPARILDLCCGSGCIGLASAHVFSEAEVVLSDISTKALLVAQRNILAHQLGERVSTVASDGFECLEGCFDLIVSNPPYVDAEDLAAMPAEYHAEPKIGLASGEDGLEFTRIILKNAANYLNDGGSIIVEVGNTAETLEALLASVPFMWPEFTYGGHGVFVLSKADLLQHKDAINAF